MLQVPDDKPPCNCTKGGLDPLGSTHRFYSMVDLFAGCGGLSLGFERAHFTPVFVSELDKDAMGTYLQNRHHELGGETFSANSALRCHDAHELRDRRLDRLVDDLSSLSEMDFRFDRGASEASGAGSTLDVLSGGPPCQGYSAIGFRRSYAVDRKEIPSNQLYRRMASVIRRLRPRIFLFENVRGLLNSKWTREGRERIWPEVFKEFNSIPGYEVRWSLVYAKDYGVPQNRPRVLLVGIRRDIVDACDLEGFNPGADPEPNPGSPTAIDCGFLPPGTAGNYPHLEDLLGDLVDDEVASILRSGAFPSGTFFNSKYPRSPKTKIQKRLREAPSWYPGGQVVLTEQEYSKHSREVVDKFDHMLLNCGEIPAHYKTKKFSQRLLPPSWGDGGPNITATSLPDDYVHFSQPRILTVREWARLQLFPDWYTFTGKRTTGGLRRAGNPLEGVFDKDVPKYTQIGNAVPVALAECVGHHFRTVLDNALGSDA